MKASISDYNAGRIAHVEFSKDDFYSLDFTLAQIIAPALREFKACAHDSWPSLGEQSLQDAKVERAAILDSMIYAFEAICDDTVLVRKDARIQKGLDLFAKHYRDLWY